MLAILGDQILTPQKEIHKGAILVDDGKIFKIGPAAEISIPAGAEILNVGDKIIIPGMIDTHTHGRDGEYYGEDPSSTAEHARKITNTGVTSFLPT